MKFYSKNIVDVDVQAHQTLLAALRGVHAGTVRATVRREGEWPNLDYAHHLGFGARRIAAMCIGKKVESFKVIAENLLHDDEYAEAYDFIRQVTHLLETSTDAFLKRLQIVGRAAFIDELKKDKEFWLRCEEEWGQGPGYRDRVTDRNRDWFSEPNRQRLHDFIKQMIENEWEKVLASIGRLLETGPASST